MSQPEVSRQLNQQRDDIDGLYEIAERLESKVDAGFDDLRNEVTAVRAELSTISTQLDARLPRPTPSRSRPPSADRPGSDAQTQGP